MERFDQPGRTETAAGLGLTNSKMKSGTELVPTVMTEVTMWEMTFLTEVEQLAQSAEAKGLTESAAIPGDK